MANRTVKDATSIKGTNPQYLVEKIIRSRIYDSRYWKEECFALSAELLVDKAMHLRHVGGVFGGNIKPTPFLCLVLKMLQIQPEKDIIIEFIKNENFKYVRALGAYYMRLTGTSLDCYKYLEPLLNDYRKLRLQDRQGVFELTFMDEFIDNLLREERMCDVILPRIQRRQVHEETGELEVRVSALEDDLDELAESSGDEEPEPAPAATSPPPQPPPSSGRHRRSTSRERVRDGYRRREPAADYRPGPEYPTGFLRPEPYREPREHRYPPPERGHYPPETGGRHHHRSSDHHRAEKRHHRADDGHAERREKRHRREGRDARDGRDGRDAEKESRRAERRSHREHRGERRERRERGGDERRSGRHRDEDQRREIDEANALRAKLGLPPLRP